MPSFTLVITNAEGIETARLEDLNPATKREVHLDIPLSPLPQSGNDPLMTTVDTRFAGQLAYEAVYSPTKANGEDEDQNSDAGTVFEPYRDVEHVERLDSTLPPRHRRHASRHGNGAGPPHSSQCSKPNIVRALLDRIRQLGGGLFRNDA